MKRCQRSAAPYLRRSFQLGRRRDLLSGIHKLQVIKAQVGLHGLGIPVCRSSITTRKPRCGNRSSSGAATRAQVASSAGALAYDRRGQFDARRRRNGRHRDLAAIIAAIGVGEIADRVLTAPDCMRPLCDVAQHVQASIRAGAMPGRHKRLSCWSRRHCTGRLATRCPRDRRSSNVPALPFPLGLRGQAVTTFGLLAEPVTVSAGIAPTHIDNRMVALCGGWLSHQPVLGGRLYVRPVPEKDGVFLVLHRKLADAIGRKRHAVLWRLLLQNITTGWPIRNDPAGM